MSQLYQPTAIEQAYCLYLGQQVFGVLPGASSIQISGRDAVPFLTQSNVDRGILRSLWTVADPQSIGTLSQLSQFHLLLRLVAMAQAGLINTSMTTDTMKSMVQQYSSQQLNLPTFSSVMVPNQNQLMSAYGNFVVNNVQPVSTTPSHQGGGGGFWSLSSYSSPSLVGNYSGPSQQTNTGFGVSQGSFGGEFHDSNTSSGLSMGTSSFGQSSNGTTFGMSSPIANSSAPLAPTTQQFGGKIPEGFNTSSQLPTVSVSDAFGDIDAPTDAPLPSLGDFGGGSLDQSEKSATLQTSGSKESIPNNDSYQSALQNTDSFQSGPSMLSGGQQQGDGFGSFESTGQTSMQQVPETTEHNQQLQQGEKFGSFESTGQTTMQQPSATSDSFGAGQNAAMPSIGQTSNPGEAPTAESDPFGPLAGSQDAPLPSMVQAPGNDFGGFETVDQSAPPQTTQTDNFGGFEAAPTPTMDEPDPFGGLPSGQDAPLPSLDQTSQPVPQLAEEDDFGGFEDAATGPVDQGAGDSDQFGAFGGSQDALGPSNDESDPFGPLGGSQDAPLPSLGQVSQPATQLAQADDFGGFEAAEPVAQQPVNDDFGGFETAKAPLGAPTNDESDPFGPLSGSQDTPLPSLEQTVQQVEAESDGFGDFETAEVPVAGSANDESGSYGGFETTTPTQMDQPNTGSDPFGTIAGSQDAPLPSFGQGAPSQQDQSDDFGVFAAAVQASADLVADNSDSFGPSQDAPLPFLGQATQADKQDDSFGDFEAAGPSNTEADTNEQSDPFGSLVGVQDAPLPSLDQFSEAAPQLAEADDFEGFETAAPAPQQVYANEFGGFETAETTAPMVDDSDPFGPLAGSQDVPLPSLGQPSQPTSQGDEGGDFGGFEASAPTTTVAAGDDSDPFGPVVGSQDAPLPSLEQMSQPIAQNQEDDFGGFEEPPVPSMDESDLFGTTVGSNDEPQMISQGDPGNDFGGFETAEAASAGAAIEDSDPFGPLSGQQDAPLPGLGQPSLPSGHEMDDGFGGFEAATPAPAGEASGQLDLFGSIKSKQDIQASGQPDVLGDTEKNDDWGAFDSSTQPPPNEGADFGDFSAPKTAPETNQDEWGGFNANASTASDAPSATIAQPLPQDDEWGAFGSSAPAPSPAPPADTPTNDDFGAFESGGAEPSVAEAPSQDDEWGAFDSNSGAPAATVAQLPAQDNNLGGFDSTTAAGTGVESTPEVNQEMEGDEWGAFDSNAGFSADAPTETQAVEKEDILAPNSVELSSDDFGATVAQPPAQDDDWGAFDSSTPAPAPSNEEANFGDFSAPAASVAQPPAQDDDWGAFDSSAPAPAPSNEEADFGDLSAPAASVAQPPAQDDDWGAFDSSAPAPAPAENPGNDDDWGAFDSNAEAETPSATVPQPPPRNDDWGDFGQATPASQGPRAASFASARSEVSGYTSASDDGNMTSDDEDFGDLEGIDDPKQPKNAVQDKIRAYASLLPEILLRKSGLSGEHVDLAECYEVNIGLDASSRNEPARVDRCLQVLAILKKKRNSKLPSYWEQLFLVVKEELQVGKQLLEEALKISKRERQTIQPKLEIMVSGFGEYLRVVRSIVGTIGDLLLLDDSALLTIDTYASTWCSLDILKIPVEIEQLWKEVEKAAAAISIRQSKDATMSLTGIRRRVSRRVSTSEQLCELTLTPLSQQDRNTTCSMVSWQGKEFMACSANILANRCPFYVVVE